MLAYDSVVLASRLDFMGAPSAFRMKQPRTVLAWLRFWNFSSISVVMVVVLEDTLEEEEKSRLSFSLLFVASSM